MARSIASQETETDAETADRHAVAAALREIAKLLAAEGDNRFRARAYERAARAVESLETFDTLVRAGRLTDVPGIGAALAGTITDLATTGHTDVLARLRQRVPQGAIELGPVLSLPRIRLVEEKLGITTLDALRAACVSGALRDLPGFGEKTERKLLERIDAHEERGERVLLPEALRQATIVLEHLRPVADRVEIAGALRRRVEAIDSLDVAAAADDVDAVVERAGTLPAALAVHRLDDGTVSVRRIGALDVRIRVAPRDGFAAAWLQATGSDGHVAKLVARLQRGNGGGADRPLDSEAAIYGHVGLPFIPPELREDAGEIEAADAGELPADLVCLADIRGAVHCHTVYSDGRNTIEEMARAAEASGLGYLTITDHSASAHYANGLDVDRLRRQWDEIARVQARVGIRLLRGTESDILRDGALDFPDAVLERLDVVIASIHNRHGLDAREMTRRLVRAMRHPLFKIWGHALGRYVLSRPPFACDVEAVLDAAAESRVAIEVNGDPHRLDLEPRWIRAARARRIPFVVSVDAHSTNGLAHVGWGVDTARRGWLRRTEVLNTRAADEFAAAVRPKEA
jgi:DNA polymerase (family 10)